MSNPPRIWLDYRPVRIGWVISNRDLAQLARAANWSACLWGGRYNYVVPVHDAALADRIITCCEIDILLPAQPDASTAAFIKRHPHLEHHQWRERIFDRQSCEFADIRHALRRLFASQDYETRSRIVIPRWEEDDPLAPVLGLLLGRYPTPDDDIADYGQAVEQTFSVETIQISPSGELPVLLLERLSPLGLASYELTRRHSRRGWLSPGIVLGSLTDFDTLAMFWNLRAAGASLIFYDQTYAERLKPFANAFLARLRNPGLGQTSRVTFWIRRDRPGDDSWKPDLELDGLSLTLSDGRGDALWNGMNIEPSRPHFSVWHRDVVPTYSESDGKANASFALPDRPFSDDDLQALSQQFVVVVDASQYGGPDADLTFATPFVPRLNEFYGRNFYHDYDAARSQSGRLDQGAVGIITSISTQRLQIDAFRVFDWMKAFFGLCGMNIARSEPGLRCSRLIAQLGGLQACRVLKIRGVRELLRKYDVEQSFTRTGAIEAIRDRDGATGVVGFDAFKTLYIEFREKGELKPDDVLRYLLERRVFRVGLEFACPNCLLPSWVHLDDVKTRSTCGYCDHTYDVAPQLKDRDWRYRRSGIFGRSDNQLGGVPVALTLQQLASSLDDKFLMYATAISFVPVGTEIETCESDFVCVVAGSPGISEAPVQILFGEAKTEGPIDAQDLRKLGKLANAIPRDLADAYILFSKTGVFSAEEIALAKTLNGEYRQRVILWSRDELETFYLYERSKEKLGEKSYAGSLTDMANITQRLFFS